MSCSKEGCSARAEYKMVRYEGNRLDWLLCRNCMKLVLDKNRAEFDAQDELGKMRCDNVKFEIFYHLIYPENSTVEERMEIMKRDRLNPL